MSNKDEERKQKSQNKSSQKTHNDGGHDDVYRDNTNDVDIEREREKAMQAEFNRQREWYM
jgi:hypothetical protein